MSTFSNICIFCSRDCIRIERLDSESEVLNEKRKAETLHQFVKLTERYLNTSFHLNTVNGKEGVLESCQDCFTLVDSFCNLYHQLKCLEMELEWKLRVLSDAINSSRTKNVTSRFSSQCSSEDGELSEGLENFRADFQQKCTRHFTKSFPKVSLNRWKFVPTPQEALHWNNQAEADFNQLFVSWVSTLAVVFQLGFENRSQTYNPEESGDKHASLISNYDDDDAYFEHIQYCEDLPSQDITCNKSEAEIGYLAASDNHFVLENVAVSKLESSELKKPVVVSQQDFNDLSKVKNRKRRGLQNYYSKRQQDLLPKALFRCSRCSRNFLTFSELQRHRRAFTHLLMKRKSLGQPVNPKLTRKPKRQIKKCNKTGTNNEDKNENVGVLRPLRVIKKPSCAKDEDESNSEPDEQDSLYNAEDEWNVSSSDDEDCSSSSSESISSSSSSGSISSDEEEERPCSATSKLEVPTESYTCTVGSCLQRFYFKEELDDHLQLHGSFPCSLCDVVKEYAPDLALHESDHMKQTRTEDQAEKGGKKRKKTTNVRRYCARCDYSTTETHLYINHYLKSHLELPTQRFMCRICKVWTANKKRFTEHMKNVHKRKAYVYKCEQCLAEFSKKVQLQKHQKTHPEVKKENNFFCDEVSCNVGFETEPELVLHKEFHGSFTCKFCPSVENHAETLAIHELTHGQSESESFIYSCPRCPLHTISKRIYISHFAWAHLRLRSGTVPCSICQTPLLTSVSKKRHFLHQHDTSGIDPESVIKCKECPAYFLKSRQLEAHKKEIHSSGQDLETSATSSESSDDDKSSNASKQHRTKCTDCGRIFVCMLTLRKHKETCKKKYKQPETITNQFSCEVGSCKHSFDFKEELEIHQKHHGNFPCQLCKVVKTFAPDLVEHELAHATEKCKTNKTHFKCARCSYKVFKSQKRSNIHIVNHYLKQHFRLPVQRVMCSICKIMYAKESLKSHHKSFHNIEGGVDAQSILKCEQDDVFFLKSTQLTEQKKRAHNSSESSSSDEEEERSCSSASNQEVATKSYTCTVRSCFQRFHFKEELDDHLQLHGRFPCSLCEVIEKYAPDLALHESEHMKQRTEEQAEKSEKKRKTINVKRNCARCSFSAEERFRFINHYLESHLDLPTQRIKCWICEAWTKDSKRFTEHMKNIHGRKADGSTVYKCEKCPANFVTKIQLLKHQKNHPVVKKEIKYFCNEVSCNAGFATNRELYVHKRLHGSFNPKFNKKCDFGVDCRMAFESEDDLENHRKLHGEFSCSRCSVVENYAPNLAVHEATHVESSLEPSKSSVKGAGNLKPYSCSRCTSVLQGRFHYVTHFLEIHMNLPSECISCQNCGEKFSSRQGLREHFNQQHKSNGKTEADKVNCDQCSAFFFKLFQLAAHKKKMHGEDNSTCLDCGRKFSSPSALRGHRATVHKINEADFPHACNIQGCERRFENTTDLVWHKQMAHDGKGRDKTMICHECGKKLSHRPALISHMRLHQTNKIRNKGSYVCEECGKYFGSEEKLNIHKLSHTGPASWEFACIFCDKKSATKQRHMEHLRAHTNEKPYVCEYCGAEYTQLNRLRDHKNKKHDANDRPQKRKIVNGQPSKKGQKLPRLKK